MDCLAACKVLGMGEQASQVIRKIQRILRQWGVADWHQLRLSMSEMPSIQSLGTLLKGKQAFLLGLELGVRQNPLSMQLGKAFELSDDINGRCC